MNNRHVIMSLVCIRITITLVTMTSCAQLPSNDAAVSAGRCPSYALDLEAEWAAPLPSCGSNR
jgi:hypothetical protein